MKENSKILYNVFKGEDEIEEELKTAITAIEEKCRAIIGKNN